LPSRHGAGYQLYRNLRGGIGWHHDDVFGMDLECRGGAWCARELRVCGQTNQSPLRPCTHNFIIMISSASVPSLRVLASRSPLRNISRAVPLAASRAHHTAPAFHFPPTGTGMSTCQTRKSRYDNRQREAALPPSG
jgi:hypothetical protein